MSAAEQVARQFANAAANKNAWNTISYNVKAFGAKGDGVNDDTSSIQETVTKAYADGVSVTFPPGEYLTTSSLTHFNDVKKLGRGVILRGTDEYFVTPFYSDTNKIYVDGTDGNDSNDGLSLNAPLKTVLTAVNVLRNLEEAALNGNWQVKLSGTFDDGVKIYDLPKFSHPVQFVGEDSDDGDGYPVTKFIHDAESTVKIGLWFEPVPDTFIEVSNIHFKDFTSPDGEGYGVILKGGGNIQINHCVAEGCNIGFSVARNVSFAMYDVTAINCTATGFKAEYNSSGSFGKLGSPATATNCPQGFYITRNSVVHIDYCSATGSTYAGINTDMAARAHVLGTTLDSCEYGVRCEGASEWINDLTTVNTFTNNTNDYAHFGVSRETRMYSITATNEFRLGQLLDRVTNTGTTASTVVYSGSVQGTLVADFFKHTNQRLRFVVSGIVSGTGNKTIAIIATSSTGTSPVTLGQVVETGTGSFVMELFIYPPPPGSTTYSSMLRYTINGNSRVSVLEITLDVSFERWFRVTNTNSDTAGSVAFYLFEVYQIG